MSKQKIITELTSEQEALIPIYQDKWVQTIYSTAPLSRDCQITAINTAYQLCNYPEPEILFYSSPFNAIQSIVRADEHPHLYLGRSLHSKFSRRVLDHLLNILDRQTTYNVSIELGNRISYSDPPYYWTEENPIRPCFHNISFLYCLYKQLHVDIEKSNPEIKEQYTSELIYNIQRTAQWAVHACKVDFCISVLELQHDQKIWDVIQKLIHECGFLLMFEKICIACPRPVKMLFDNDLNLHSNLEPALEFPDGYAVYANHGEWTHFNN
jgi:hypothetical protein